jgi:signal transduction histidine kinase
MSSVLVLDDRPADRDLLATVLGYAGYDVLQASTAQQALACAREHRLDMIITDLSMPEVNGYEFVRELRADPQVCRTRVVFCTANYEQGEVRRLAEACGVSRVLVKPCEPQEIVKVCAEVLQSADGPTAPEMMSAEFDREQLRVLNNKLVQKVNELQLAHDDLRHAHTIAIEASRAKSQFVANMSHELRTPLHGVIGMAELLRDTALNAVQRGYVNALAASGEALLAVVSEVLDFSKLESGRVELDNTDFELRAAVEDACQVVAVQAGSKGLEITCSIDAEVPAIVHGDPSRLRQVLLNLLANAVKFTASGEVSVRVCRTHDERLRFTISDTGIGIEGDDPLRLFEPFVQADESTTRRYGGTGLGLAISRRLVQGMSGEIGAEPRVGGGSVFWFTAVLPELTRAVESRMRLAARSAIGARRS